MGAMASPINSLTIVYSTIYSGADLRKHQRSASLAFVRGIHRGPVNSLHKWPVTRKMFPFDDVIMRITGTNRWGTKYSKWSHHVSVMYHLYFKLSTVLYAISCDVTLFYELMRPNFIEYHRCVAMFNAWSKLRNNHHENCTKLFPHQVHLMALSIYIQQFCHSWYCLANKTRVILQKQRYLIYTTSNM